MEIQRIDTYTDKRFSLKVLYQHGCFLVDGNPFEVEIISDYEAVIRGKDADAYMEVIDNFRFYTPHITKFYNTDGGVVKEYPRAQLLTVPLEQIQPSQFLVDRDKIAAVSTFIDEAKDIIIQVLPFEGKYISLDGHTRLYFAVMKGWNHVRAVTESSDDWVYRFVEEAKKRGVHSPKDLVPFCHDEYEVKWNRFCDELFAESQGD